MRSTLLTNRLVRRPGSDFKTSRAELGMNGHTPTECQELRKALHELIDKRARSSFESSASSRGSSPEMKNAPRRLWPLLPVDTKKASLGAQHVLTTRQGNRVTVPTMVFGRGEGPRFTSPHSNPLVLEIKVASTILWRILIDMGNSVDIITWHCLKKLKYPRKEIVPLVHPILGFGGQKVNPTRMICLPLRFGDKAKVRSLKVKFLVVDVPIAYNVILGWPTRHKAKREDNKEQEQKNPGALDIGILVMATVIMRNAFIVLAIRGPGLAVQGCSLLVASAVFLSCKRIELHQLRVPPFGLGQTTIFHVLDVRFKVAFYTEGIWCQSRQELPNELDTLLAGLPPIGAAGLSFRPPRPLSPSLASPNGAYTWPPLLLTCGAQSKDCRFAPLKRHQSSQGRVSAAPGKRQMTSTFLPSAPEQRLGKHLNMIS
ncbi:hypothetical protein Cgig2_018067 [Carnegiea gigantea]|uniref:Uncharacterized protein n=1 Tax=Carnegiea gigantea TaxID=171969 RepID=A0A9Q1QG63_9CARY|nr:hypothetical protein Cgig2_018067 [Carnegiea gigantea]